MASKSLCFFFLVLCSRVFVGFSQGGGDDKLPCMKKLLPCQPYLKASSTPPAACCVPLKEIVADDSKCLCAVFNNPDIMKSLNATQEDALNMAKNCGANADTSVCNKASTPTGSPSPPSSNSSSTSNSTAHSPAKSSAPVISYFGGSIQLAAVLSLIAFIIF
ncbi:Bifunctional inhibitor/lipid-transfer protein/seed storage 2S albumin superfamily protein [Abeliophyllum distichum]|uniref:Bifunctional inhibitor/lipid-transfer protein/seed storage 2S albumin superfamily protein n=1 Tax=Abeliophyllum distichum TaxID=126358 RepID=A0ABD1PEK9_9LAMI